MSRDRLSGVQIPGKAIALIGAKIFAAPEKSSARGEAAVAARNQQTDERRGWYDMVLPKGKTVTLTGIVIPADWNDRQEVIAAALATADEKEYRISKTKKGKELLDALQREVQVIGVLDRDEKGRNVITVRSYILK